jgi:hypothetical protein
MISGKILSDLVAFARYEQESHDLEPWAELIAHLHLTGELSREEALWVLWLYNAYDDFGSAWTAFGLWPSPTAWARDTPERQMVAAGLPIMRERRNLFGGRMLKRYASYVDLLAGDSQWAWLSRSIRHHDPFGNWNRMLAQTRQVWGVGRQASFEWTEFVSKVDVTGRQTLAAPDACLWESSGPRKSLQRIYNNPSPDRAWLERAAHECRAMLTDSGVRLAWVDFETVICDFNVMRDGRYYPGRHLAALRAEVADVPKLTAAYNAIIPEPWRSGIAAGIDPNLMPVYARTGRIVTP